MFIKYISGDVAYESRTQSIPHMLIEADQKDINLKSIYMRKTYHVNASYKNIDFSQSSFWGGRLNHIQFINCTMARVDFRISKLKNVLFKNCNLSHTDFRGVCLKKIDFIQSNLSYCKFNDPNIFYYKNFLKQELLGAKYFSKDGNKYFIQ